MQIHDEKITVHQAKKIAIKIHGNQTDKLGVPYIAHVEDVARRVAHLGTEYELVGLLHDALEDAPVDAQEALLGELNNLFSKEVITAINSLTKRKPPRYQTKEDYFDAYLPRLVKSEMAKIVKIADSSHNLSKAHLIEDLDLQAKLRRKYISVLNFLGVDGISCERPLIFVNESWAEKP